MKNDSTDFMITEYDKIASAYFGLRDQVNEWFKAYLILVGFPLTILAAVLAIGNVDNLTTSINDLPDIVSSLLILVGFLGLFVTLTIISMRMEMILYARTINGVRRYFGQLDEKLPEYLILPTSDAKPDFYETWRAMFWQVTLIGLLDGVFIIIGIQSLLNMSWFVSIFLGLVFWLLHWGIYRFTALLREKEWEIRFDEDLNIPHH